MKYTFTQKNLTAKIEGLSQDSSSSSPSPSSSSSEPDLLSDRLSAANHTILYFLYLPFIIIQIFHNAQDIKRDRFRKLNVFRYTNQYVIARPP